MTDPLSLLPFALAAADGQVDGLAVRRLVAAGVTLLQRCPPLVRAMGAGPSLLLLEPSPALVVGLAASDGRVAVMTTAQRDARQVEDMLREEGVGAILAVERYAPLLPPGAPCALLDGAPDLATWRGAGREQAIDLTSHVGLSIEGDAAAEGSADDVARFVCRAASGHANSTSLSHRDILAAARAWSLAMRLASRDLVLVMADEVDPVTFTHGLVAPLLRGARVRCLRARQVQQGLEALTRDGVSVLVAEADAVAGLLSLATTRQPYLDAPVLRHCVATSPAREGALAERWHAFTGVPLQAPPPWPGRA